MDANNIILEYLKTLSQYLNLVTDSDSNPYIGGKMVQVACGSFEKILLAVEPENTLALRLVEGIKSIDNVYDACSQISEVHRHLLEQKMKNALLQSEMNDHSYLSKITSACKEFCYTSEHLSKLPSVPGLYVVVKTEGFQYITLYVGMSQDIRSRWKAHHRKPEFDLLKKTGSRISIYCLPVPGASDAILRLQEGWLIKKLNPLLNDTPIVRLAC